MRSKKDFDKQNEYNRKKYDNITIMVQKGNKAIWKEEAVKRNLSVNAFVINAVEYYIKIFSKES